MKTFSLVGEGGSLQLWARQMQEQLLKGLPPLKRKPSAVPWDERERGTLRVRPQPTGNFILRKYKFVLKEGT